MDTITIAIIVGTKRPERESIKVARYIEDFTRKLLTIEVIFVDPKELNLPDDGDDIRDPKYTEITEKADAFVIVVPEYNHGYSGSLKRLLDSEYDNYMHKPVALVGVSSGSWGGVRACEALLPVCHRLGLVNIQPELYFPHVAQMFDEQGLLKSEYTDRYQASTERVLSELLWFARLLKANR